LHFDKTKVASHDARVITQKEKSLTQKDVEYGSYEMKAGFIK